MSELISVSSHVFNANYNNTSNLFNGQGVTINGVKFTDFTWSSGLAKGTYYSLMNVVTPAAIESRINQGNYDNLNKMIGMLFVNWNGAIIKNGDFINGNDVVISTTPEFLAIFNNMATVTYEHVIQESKITNKIPMTILLTKTVSANTTIATIGFTGSQTINDHEVADVIYENTGSSSITISLANNTTVGDLTGCTFKVPNPLGLSIVVPAQGYAELSFLRIGNTVYARGV